MNIKNSVSLTIAEAVELLTKIADSLEQKHEFAFDLKGQEVSIEAGSTMNALLSLSPDEFSIVFNWEDVEETSSEETSEEMYQSPHMIKEVNIPERSTEQQPQIKADKPEPVNMIPKRALPDRMPLNTTTLPYDAGYWAPAFTSNDAAQWTVVQIDSELENKKWASDDQITSLSDLTPESAKPKKIRRQKSDDDLFSELDNLDSKPKPKSSTPSSSSVQKVEIPSNRVSSPPPAAAGSIPKPSTSSTPRSAIPSPGQSQAQKQVSSSPPPAAAAGDTWVKPSEVLKNKNKSGGNPGVSNIPSPSANKSSETSKRKSIPSPTANKQSQDDEALGWKEPSREDNVTDDEWIKPSEFLKKRDANDPAKRPPPTAPDADE